MENINWVPWTIKRQRPDKVPGVQEVFKLPKLEDSQTCCGEKQLCFYFSCHKCSSLLALDNFNTSYRSEVNYIPRISCISRPEVFEEDNKYHGEVHELYFNYLAQIPEFSGIAINGWSNLDAKKLFNSVDQTFQGIKSFQKSEDFEMDWLLFNGSSITIIEVKEKSEKGNSRRNFERKMEQIKKDEVIIQHLLDAVRCSDVAVNFIIACPNVSIKEVTDSNFLQVHRETLRQVSQRRHNFGFISEECMGTKMFYKYDCDSEKLLRQNLVTVNRNSDSGLDLNVDWTEEYKHCVSLVVLSMLLMGTCIENQQNHPLTKPVQFELKQKKRKCQIMPPEARNEFPECLILGPDQVDAIKCKSNRVLLSGEVGCGKTLVLLALLYRNTANCLAQLPNPNYKKVLFVIPEEKTELRKFVEDFVDKYCRREYIFLVSAVNIIKSYAVDLILIDELYPFSVDCHAVNRLEAMSKSKICAALIYTYDDEGHFQVGLNLDDSKWTVFYLRKAYRCPVNITMRCAKLRRLFISKETTLAIDPTLSLCLHYGVNVVDEFCVKTWNYCFEKSSDFPVKQFQEERMLAVIHNVQINDPDLLADFSFVENVTDVKMGDQHRQFTGVQYHSVFVFLGPSEFWKEGDGRGSWSHNIGKLLYHALSRSIHRVVVICHESDHLFFENLLSIDKGDIQVFEKLRKLQKVPVEHFHLLESRMDKLEALRILIITKNYNQFSQMAEVFNHDGIREEVEAMLVRYFPYGENGDILKMLRHNVDEGKVSSVYESTAMFLSTLDKIPSRRKLLPRFKALFEDTFASIIGNYSVPQLVFVMIGSVVWKDTDIFNSTLAVIKRTIMSLFSELCSLSQELPSGIICCWLGKLGDNIMDDSEGKGLLETFSTVKRNGELNFQWSHVKQACLQFCNPFCNECTETPKGCKNFANYMKLAFERVVFLGERGILDEKESEIVFSEPELELLRALIDSGETQNSSDKTLTMLSILRKVEKDQQFLMNEAQFNKGSCSVT